jgi:cytochrome c peroxidase
MKMMILTAVLLAGFSGPALAENVLDPDLAPLGEKLFFDKISDPDSMSCAECHGPKVGWTGPDPGTNKHGAVYRAAVPQRFGNRKPPSSGYATPAPPLYHDDDEGFIGGNFWDGRATGWLLGNPAADQALGPFLNPVEQNNEDRESVIAQVCWGKYADEFVSLFNEKVNASNPCDPANVDEAYGFIGLAIAAYEDSEDVNAYTSKYDYYLAGEADLTEQEMLGLEVFEVGCSECHTHEPGPGGEPPLFTNFTYYNLGTPKNPENPFYEMDQVFLDDGSAINPDGDFWIDPGLGGFLASLAEGNDWRSLPFVTNVADFTEEELLELAEENYGKHKVPTLRNVALRPGNGFPKAYMHNGVFKTLAEIVDFYSARIAMIDMGHHVPEVGENIETEELNDLGLTDEEKAALVAFMEILSDGWVPRGKK